MATDGDENPRLKILVVDDDALSLAVMSLLLGAEGHEVTKAESGDEALRLLARAEAIEAPDVLLVDMQMPGMSGTRLAAQLRKMINPKAVLLAMSATAGEKPPGYDDFLLKPLDVKALESAAQRRAQMPGARAKGGEGVVLDKAIYGNLKRAMPEASVAEVYAACLDDTRRRVPEMRILAENRELDELRRIAHAIKGGAGMVGAIKLASLADHLETGTYHFDEVAEMLDELVILCGEVERSLEVQKNL